MLLFTHSIAVIKPFIVQYLKGPCRRSEGVGADVLITFSLQVTSNGKSMNMPRWEC